MSNNPHSPGIAEEIRKALENIRGKDWVSDDANGMIWDNNGRVIIEYTANEEEGDIHLIANAPTWLRSLLEEVEKYKRLHVNAQEELDAVHSQLADKDKVRPSVQWFAEQMEQTLRANDHKGGWEGCSYDYLINRLYQESDELWRELERRGITNTNVENVIRESTDVANFAMMIAEKARSILQQYKEADTSEK